jgi:CheY-like chemotaxis protein
MDASIGIRSEPGVGSSFWIELLRLEPVVVPANSQRVAHIFYADNDAANQQAVCEALSGLGRVSVAGDGRVALDQLLCDPADLLLLDLELPGMAGEELLKQLRSNPQTAAMPVVLMAAGMSAEVAAAAVNCQGLLSKPLDLNELHGLVEALLSEVLDDAE